ncbi:hypothetical protein AVEN_5065-1 [Araneus ventricosus]|uniref:Uncharacterized protein n=1 Tax=Araneus ventricosus TaxID=182803 RepID=A0A4Y2LDD5_ARAVE|nr:hypothetical protein AVEN_5065-1 [Araneus ventricosus]
MSTKAFYDVFSRTNSEEAISCSFVFSGTLRHVKSPPFSLTGRNDVFEPLVRKIVAILLRVDSVFTCLCLVFDCISHFIFVRRRRLRLVKYSPDYQSSCDVFFRTNSETSCFVFSGTLRHVKSPPFSPNQSAWWNDVVFGTYPKKIVAFALGVDCLTCLVASLHYSHYILWRRHRLRHVCEIFMNIVIPVTVFSRTNIEGNLSSFVFVTLFDV